MNNSQAPRRLNASEREAFRRRWTRINAMKPQINLARPSRNHRHRVNKTDETRSKGSATLSLGSKVVRLIFNIHVHLRFLSAIRVHPRLKNGCTRQEMPCSR
jgi:hypothetical protein